MGQGARMMQTQTLRTTAVEDLEIEIEIEPEFDPEIEAILEELTEYEPRRTDRYRCVAPR
jgi:hypothetical protein